MIRQYDVFDNQSAITRAKVPYVVVLQSHLFEALPTLVIAPMMRLDQSVHGGKILVEVNFADERLVVNTAFLTNIERLRLGRSRGSLAAYEDDIRRAVDRLFTGFYRRSTTVRPIGARATTASCRSLIANGMPMIVTASAAAATR